MKYTLSEWKLLVVVGFAYFIIANCILLQASFYPIEAERKGCTSTEYGFVFGCFEFIVFLASPIFGSLIQKVGLKNMLVFGIVVNAVSNIVYGFLIYVDDRKMFLVLSLILRCLGSLGATGVMVATFSLMAVCFPKSMASTFSILETCYGLGYISGPTIGALLFEIGGFLLPFAVMGLTTLGLLLFVCVFLNTDAYESPQNVKKISISHMLRIPTVLVDCAAALITATAMGYYSSVLEPHIREFELSPIHVGFVFFITGGVYVVTTPIAGYVFNNIKGLNPKKSMIFASVLTIISYSIVGPAPFVPLDKSMLLINMGLIFQELALALICVASFVDSIAAIYKNGFPEDMQTFGLLYGIWSSSFALGAFLGPTIAGVLYDLIGFQNGTYFEIILHLALGLVLLAFVCLERRPSDKLAMVSEYKN